MWSPERLNRRLLLTATGHGQTSTHTPAGVGQVDETRRLPAGGTEHLQAKEDAARLKARVKRGNVARKRRNKILRLARGFRGGNGTLFRTANQRVMKALCNAYRDRRRRKRDFRRLWIARINAAARINGVSYSRLMGGLKKADVRLNRKMLAQLAVVDPGSFNSVVSTAKG